MALPRDFDRIIQLIPGYDPVATAEPGMYFDPAEASRALDFFEECLTHQKGKLAGKPLTLEPWQQGVIANLFGWKRADGTRRYREGILYIPRKNGKTTIVAGVVLYLLFCDGELGAEIYSAAAEREQAALVFQQAKGMVLREPELSDRSKIYLTTKQIEFEEANSFYRAISAEAESKHGYNGHGIVVDELHAQPNAELVDVLKTSTGSREQPIVFYLTTADHERESVCNRIHSYACKVRDGEIEDASFLPIIYEASKDDDWTDPEIWAKANPNLGISVSREYLARECKRAREEPDYENTFKRLHLNIKTEQAVRWLPMHLWDECPVDAIPDEVLRRSPCYAGIDISNTEDITALVLAFDVEELEQVALRCWFWVPGESAEKRRRKDGVPYPAWAREGLITLTDGNAVNYGSVEAKVVELAERYRVREVAYDPWNAEQTAQRLQEIHGITMIRFPQGYRHMNEPSKYLQRLIIDRKLNHEGNKVLRWMATNVTASMDPNENIRPDKGKSSEKIDGIVASIIALGRLLVRDKGESVYETRGMLQV